MPKAKPEFLILEIGEARSAGATLILRGTAESMEKAKEELTKLTAAPGARLAIVETRGVFMREPVVNVKPISENVVPAPK